MLAALRQRLVLLLAALAAVSCSLWLWGRGLGTSEGALGPAVARLFLPVTLVALMAAALTVAVRLVRERAGKGAGVARLQAGIAHGLLTLVVGLSGFEIAARVWKPIPPEEKRSKDSMTGVTMPHERLGWVGRPGFDAHQPYDFHHEDGSPTGQRLTVRLRNNSKGFRDIEQERDETKPGVVVVGDSYAWGHCVELEETAVTELRRRLPEAQVFTLACQAYSLDQIVLSYEVLGRAFKPKVVVLLFLFLPTNMRSVPIGWGLQKPWFRLERGELVLQGVPIEFGKDFAERERIVKAHEAEGIWDVATAWTWLAREWGEHHMWLLRRGCASYDQYELERSGLPLPPPVILAILQRLQKAVAADGGKLVIATGTALSLVRWEREAREKHALEKRTDPKAKLATPLQRVMAHFAEAGLDVVDLTEVFMPEGEKLYDRDDHPGVEGNRRIGVALAGKVAPLLAR